MGTDVMTNQLLSLISRRPAVDLWREHQAHLLDGIVEEAAILAQDPRAHE
jgi:hypothetical protein